MHTYSENTSNINIEVIPTFLPEQSDIHFPRYVFSYRVSIRNNGSEKVQLLSRHWIITDGYGTVEEVSGPGVVGEQPVIIPGRSYVYESFCPLPTPTGNMRGSYLMVDSKGKQFKAKIPLFFLRTDVGVH